MNKKGMTLIEMVVAIMILSIAGIMIFSGFMAVLNYVEKANVIKNQSDQLNAYAENSDDADLQERIKTTASSMNYTISNEKGDQVQVQAVQNLFTIKKQGEISLKKLTKDTTILSTKIKDTAAYKQLNKIAEDLIELANQYEKDSGNEEIIKDILNEDQGYNEGSGEFMKLSSEQNSLLPKSMNASAVTPYYVRIHYPWDLKDTKGFFRGDKFIYLSVEPKVNFDLETIHVIYDYGNKNWYYFKGNDYQMTNIDPMDLNSDNWETNLWIRNSNRNVTTWKAFKMNELKSGNGWQLLDEEAIYDPNDPDAAWKPY